MSYTKIVLADELIDSDLPDDPFLREDLTAYFPTGSAGALRDPDRRPSPAPRDHRHPGGQRPGQRRRRHLLPPALGGDRRLGGGADPGELRRSRDLRVAASFVDELKSYDNASTPRSRLRMRIEMRTLVERASRWLVNNRRPPLDSQGTVDFFREPVQRVMRALPELLTGRELTAFEGRRDRLMTQDVPDDLASRVAVLDPGVRRAARRRDRRPGGSTRSRSRGCTSRSVSGSGCRPGAADLRAARATTGGRPWPAAPLRDDLYAVHGPLTATGARARRRPRTRSPSRIAAWEDDDQVVVNRAVADSRGDLHRRQGRPGADVGRSARGADAAVRTRRRADAAVGRGGRRAELHRDRGHDLRKAYGELRGSRRRELRGRRRGVLRHPRTQRRRQDHARWR